MTEPNLERLAEFAAEFLGLVKDGHWWGVPMDRENWLQESEYHENQITKIFFHPDYMDTEAPILMHLGKREMEKRDYWWEGFQYCDDYMYRVQESGADSPCLSEEESNNEFIAFWSAVEKAVGDK